ncbi:MAG TPA: hypothetical protein GX724_02310 [Fibrobacter sp.]|nr:hypothetical protein [Fibrobacter sp.]
MLAKLAVIILLMTWGVGVANENLLIGDSCYSARALNAEGDKADIANINKMISAYKAARLDPSAREEATEGLLKAYYFSLRFADYEKSKRKVILEQVKNFAEEMHALYPKNRQITQLHIITLSMWGAETNPLRAIKLGVARKVINLADSISDYQVLGRSHQILPYIPIILPWPDKKLAEKFLTKALKEDPKDPFNYFFLSENRFHQGLYEEAESLINAGLDLGVRTEFFLEDKRGRWYLKELHKKIIAKKK